MIKYETEIVIFNLFVPKLFINQKHLPVILLITLQQMICLLIFTFSSFYFAL